jgi:exopolysaccharide biosynthesis WecB/TagA/CpsF family protein
MDGDSMRDLGKKNIIGVLVNAIDYEAAIDKIVRAARERRSTTVSALAVHGVMTGVLDGEHKYRLNQFDLLVPDGQPVRWALNWLHAARLKDRVRGPSLTLKICERAAADGLPLYLYGSTPEILTQFKRNLETMYPGIKIAGAEPSKFRRLTPDERLELAQRIQESGACIALVGLGCPRQETFAFELREHLPMPILAVGAAFPFVAGLVPEAPGWMQEIGMEWMFRLMSEPRRLWRRYLYLNPAYLFLLLMQALRLQRFSTDGKAPLTECLFG